LEGERFPVQGGGEQDVLGEQVVQASFVAVPVLAMEGQEPCRFGRVHAGADDLLVHVPERHSRPVEVEARPGGHAVKLGSLLTVDEPGQRGVIEHCTRAVGPDEFDRDRCELVRAPVGVPRQAEARKIGTHPLARRQQPLCSGHDRDWMSRLAASSPLKMAASTPAWAK